MVRGAVKKALGEVGGAAIKSFRCVDEQFIPRATGLAMISGLIQIIKGNRQIIRRLLKGREVNVSKSRLIKKSFQRLLPTMIAMVTLLHGCQNKSPKNETVRSINMECSDVNKLMVRWAVKKALGEAGVAAIKSFRCAEEDSVSYTTGLAVISGFDGALKLDFVDYSNLAATNAPVATFGPVLPELFSSSGEPIENLEYFEVHDVENLRAITVFRSKAVKDILYAMAYQSY